MEEDIRKVNVEEIAREPRKRQTAYKLRIASLSSHAGDGIVEVDNKQIIRVNIVANVIDKIFNDFEKKYAAITIDDASSQIRVKTFGEDIEKLHNVEIGDTVLIIGNLRFFNNEIYILPEIVRKLAVEWLLVRKLELGEPENTANEVVEEKIQDTGEKIQNIREKIIGMLKTNEEGLDMDKLIMSLHEPVEKINSTIEKMLDDAQIYEPKPGTIRLL